jgi:hypothetical protein
MDDYLTLKAQEAGPAGPSKDHGRKCAPTLSRQRGRRGQACNRPHDCPDRPGYSSCQPATASRVTADAILLRRDDAQRPRTKGLGLSKTGPGLSTTDSRSLLELHGALIPQITCADKGNLSRTYWDLEDPLYSRPSPPPLRP